MALSRGRTQDIPTDAVIISEDEAINYQWKIITEWDKARDVWALRHSPTIVAALSAACGIFVNNHYRHKLRLGTYGRLSTYLPIVVVPALFSALAHKVFIQRPLILRPLDQCPLCLQLRAAAVQTGLGVVYPTILAPFAAFMFATRHFTYRLPSIVDKPLEVLKLWRSITRPILPTLGTILGGQALVVMYITYKQMMQTVQVQMELKKLEQQPEIGELL